MEAAKTALGDTAVTDFDTSQGVDFIALLFICNEVSIYLIGDPYIERERGVWVWV
jgi:hypothetical protein